MCIFDRLREAFGPRPAPDFDAALAPATPLAVIGDVHGRADLLSLMLERLKRDASGCSGGGLPRPRRGEAGGTRKTPRAIGSCLSEGKLRAMCLAFLEDPAQHGSRWLRNGGLQTLTSFGIGLEGEVSEAERMTAARDAVADALEDEGQA